MNSDRRTSLIWELNQTINKHVANNDLFCGGCCYSAYVLAAALKHAGIKYRTVIWQYLDILKTRDFNAAINGNGVSHVGIEVTLRGHKVILGDYSGIKSFFAHTGYQYKVMKYTNVDPEEILEGYKKNQWNIKYNTRNNKYLAKDIRKVTAKYAGTPEIKISYKKPRITFQSLFGFFFI